MKNVCSLFPPSELKCEHVASPLGVQTVAPLLSWELTSVSRGARQTAWAILVSSSREDLLNDAGDLWDNGRVSSVHGHALYAGRAPTSGERVHWKIRVWDEEGRISDWSAPAVFEFGILSRDDWRGEWIGAGDIENAPFLRHEFKVPRPLRRARAYFSGLGYGELYVNGFQVGDGKLIPGWTNYDRREFRDMLYPHEDHSRKQVLYVVFDVTSLIRAGQNAVGCVLGNGMHNQRVRTIEGKMWYGPPRLLLNVVLEYEDGAIERICSGETWKWTEGPLLFNNVFTGEIYDARRELPDAWAMPGFDDSKWNPVLLAPRPVGELHSQIFPPDTVVDSLPAVATTEPQPGLFILDFGRIVSGWLKVAVSGPAGTRVVMRFSENIKDDGTLDTMSAGSDHIQQDEFVLAGKGIETYEPRFVWHCFRYAEISGWPEGAPSVGEIEAKVVHMDTPVTGDFSCSHPLFGKIVDLFRATQLANQHGGVPSDCPHRERLGYTGDGQITAEAVMWNFQVASFYTKWIDDIFDAQNEATGFIPHTVPFYGGGGGPGWGSAGIIVPWNFYRFYGDAHVLENNYRGMVKWIEYLERHTDKRGVVTSEEPGGWCLGDWSFPKSWAGEPSSPVIPEEFVNTYFFGICMKLMEQIASMLGKTDDAANFGAKLLKIRCDFHREFFDTASGSYAGGMGGANAFALLLGAVPDHEKERVAQSLLRDSERRDTGIFGTPAVIQALMENNGAARACEMMAATSYPSIGYMLASGATTLWEAWSGQFGSHCHPMFGGVTAWMYRWVVGLDQAEDSFGFDRLIWKPWRGPELNEARLSFRSRKGPIDLEWRRNEHTFLARISIPPGTSAKLILPLPSPEQEAALYLDGTELALASKASPTRGVVRAWKAKEEIGIEILSGKYEFMIST